MNGMHGFVFWGASCAFTAWYGSSFGTDDKRLMLSALDIMRCISEN